jgi:tRNA modification GTPase
MDLDDTIAAIVTPIGLGGVGILRISGDESTAIADRIISNFPSNPTERYLYNGTIPGTDEILFAVFKSPKSYTGEDVVEINCHGGNAIVKKILAKIIANGARQADPGEFTKRAYLNGKMDLAQAEAVLDLVSASTSRLVDVAFGQLKGVLSEAVDSCRSDLLSILAEIEASLDFSDEVSSPLGQDTKKRISEVLNRIDALLASRKTSVVLRNGATAVILGKPHVGKSSLLNALIGENRAIVTDIPGTTRDVVGETVDLLGIPLRILDTAGIRSAEGKIEQLGIDRARNEAQKADFIIKVLDASEGEPLNEDREILAISPETRSLIVMNKVDLGDNQKMSGIRVSALTGQGVEELKQAINNLLLKDTNLTDGNLLLLASRHEECLLRAKDALGRVLSLLGGTPEPELLAIDLKAAIVSLGEISGVEVSEEVIDRIFAEFCVGK